MLDRQFTSTEEVSKVYADHLESLLASGLPFDEAGLRAEWDEAIRNVEEGRTVPPWLDPDLSL